MLSYLNIGRYVIGDAIMELLSKIYYPDEKKFIVFAPKTHLAESFGEWIHLCSANMISKIITFNAIMMLISAVCYVKLPQGIADRVKIQTFELLLRISNEYLGHWVEFFFGPKVRNISTRFWISLPFFICYKRHPKWITIKNKKIDGVKCRVYIPQKGKGSQSDRAIIFIHGGGFCTMRTFYYDPFILNLIKELGCTVVSIDYSLAPNTLFPGPVDECLKVATIFCEKLYQDYGIDKEKIAIMGDSAGACLSTVISRRLANAGKKYFKAQVLIYPVVSFDFQTPSFQHHYKEYPLTGLLNAGLLARWMLLYIGIPATNENVQKVIKNEHISEEVRKDPFISDSLDLKYLPSTFTQPEKYTKEGTSSPCPKLSSLYTPHPDLCPLIAEENGNSPDAMVITCGFDILASEGILYARKLQRNGVMCTHRHYTAAYHGIINMPFSKQKDQIINDIVKYLQKRF